MAYQPVPPLLNFQQVTTSEQLSGRSFDGAPTYIKLVKQSGALGTGTNITIAHGISGMTRLLRIDVGMEDSLEWLCAPLGIRSVGGNAFALSVRADGTNVILDIGTSWTAGTALSNCWAILEYLK